MVFVFQLFKKKYVGWTKKLWALTNGFGLLIAPPFLQVTLLCIKSHIKCLAKIYNSIKI